MRTVFLLLLVLAMGLSPGAQAATRRILFDNGHQETAGNADWQVDTHQPVPVPSPSTITMATARTTWAGAISSWGIDLAKRGYDVATLTSALGITYQNPSNPYDLSLFDTFVLPEPNSRFTAAESTAIWNYVRDGGGLVLVADHMGSDRNGDGTDSPRILDRLDAGHRWGVSFDTSSSSSGPANFSDVYSTNVNPNPLDSVIHGPIGFAAGLEFHNGTSLVLYPGIQPSVVGDVWRTGFVQGNTGLMAAHSAYGLGRIFFLGDSSPIDDGSATPGNSSIFDGWGEAAGNDSILIMNGTLWTLRRTDVVGVESDPGRAALSWAPGTGNPARGTASLAFRLGTPARVAVEVFDIAGRKVWSLEQSFEGGEHAVGWDGRSPSGGQAPPGIYLVRAGAQGRSIQGKLVYLGR